MAYSTVILTYLELEGDADSALKGTKPEKSGEKSGKLGKDRRKRGKNFRKQGVSKGERKNFSKRGFKSHQVDTSAILQGTSAANSELRASSVEEVGTLLDSDAESDCSAEPVPSTLSAKGGQDAKGGPKKAKRKKRYLLFVGNLPRTATQEEIVSHFQKRGVCMADFRLLSHKDTGKSKGCGFMEFGSDKAMQNALKFHRSRMLKKRVNVEVTCGGGGKSENRQARISEKNRTLRRKKATVKPFKPRT